jgi:type I restriction enzyme R subunit
VLTRNADAFQIGLTATPRELTVTKADQQITGDNLRHFGEPVYEYSLTQGIEDGYLAPCEIKQGRVSIDESSLLKKEVIEHKPRRVDTGRLARKDEVRDSYAARDYDAKLQIPERVAAMCDDLFQYLLDTGGPEQKTVVFCAADAHADRVASRLNNLYADWCVKQGRARAEPYAFKCTDASSGNKMVDDLRGTSSAWFVATTVDLLSTGVDVPCVRNIVFFRYLESAIVFHQMVGRGTRIDETSGKLMFRLYDYTNMIRLFGRDFVTPPPRSGSGGGEPQETEPTLVAKGFSVQVQAGGHFVLGEKDGKLSPVAYADYKRELAEQLQREAADIAQFRERWIAPPERRELLESLVASAHSPTVVQMVDAMQDYDLFDVLASLGYGARARTRIDRHLAFRFKNEDWLDKGMPSTTRAVILGIAGQFEKNGTEALEDREIWRVPSIERAGGMVALKVLGRPALALKETKARLFSA